MTNDERKEWAEIVEAWAKWVKGQGPVIQHTDWDTTRTPHGWKAWTSSEFLDRRLGDSWRVKPAKRFARFYRIGEGTGYAIKREHDPDPELREGQRYFGDWQEIPE